MVKEVKRRGVKKRCLYETNVLPHFEDIKKYRSAGKTEVQIAKLLGISYGSFLSYKEKYPELEKVVNDSKIILIENLEHTLYELALGHITIKETKKFIQQGGEKQNIRIEENIKELGPNVTALIFALKNLCSERWGDQNNINLNVDSAMTNMQTVFTELKAKLNSTNIREVKDEVESTDS